MSEYPDHWSARPGSKYSVPPSAPSEDKVFSFPHLTTYRSENTEVLRQTKIAPASQRPTPCHPLSSHIPPYHGYNQ